MTPIDYSKFRLSLRRLAEQLDNHRSPPSGRSRLDTEGVAESVIQRFETCYDCLWKVLKRYLNQELGLAELPNSPRRLFTIAVENSVFDSPLDQWERYVNARVDTAHDYDGKKAQACLDLVPDFVADAVALYETMTGETWD